MINLEEALTSLQIKIDSKHIDQHDKDNEKKLQGKVKQ